MLLQPCQSIATSPNLIPNVVFMCKNSSTLAEFQAPSLDSLVEFQVRKTWPGCSLPELGIRKFKSRVEGCLILGKCRAI